MTRNLKIEAGRLACGDGQRPGCLPACMAASRGGGGWHGSDCAEVRGLREAVAGGGVLEKQGA